MTDRPPAPPTWPGAAPTRIPRGTGNAHRYRDVRPIAGTDVQLHLTFWAQVDGDDRVPGDGELVLTGPDDLAALDGVVREIEQLRRPDSRFAGIDLHLLADHPADRLLALPEQVADAIGFTHRRELLQLRRPLPVPPDHPARARAPEVAMRPYHPIDPPRRGRLAVARRIDPESGTVVRGDWDDGEDDADAWLSVNNRAFAHHPDQGNKAYDDVLDLEGEDWFDPDGFLVADDPARPGRLSGFCLTKVHPPTEGDPELGEIYVIGVDPSHAGEGLGASFTLAGLDHLAGRGIATAMLYVESDNEPARRLYDRLGFATHLRRRLYAPEPW